MTAQEASQQWAEGANDALDSAQALYRAKKYHHALFFCHLALEKALKARYIRDNSELPPYTHDLTFLVLKTTLTLSSEQLDEIAEANTFNISARYKETKLDLARRATAQYTEEWLNKCELILRTLLP